MRFPVVGASAPDDEELNSQRTINYYMEADKKSEHKIALINTPGAERWLQLDTYPIRKILKFDGNLIVASGNAIYEVEPGGGISHLGSLQTSTGNVSMSHNGSEVFIVDDTYGNGFIWDGQFFTEISDPDFTDKKHFGSVFHDGYFVTMDQGTGQFRISATYDGEAWNALDFATSEAKPDNIVDILSSKNMLWAFNVNTIEVFQNTGNPDFPFEPMRPAFQHYGAVPDTPAQMDNTLYWLARSLDGGITVMRFNGMQPEPLSTPNIQEFLQGLDEDEVEAAYANTLLYKGHPWYILTFPTAGGFGRTFVYDSTVGDFFEWSTQSPATDKIGQHLGNSYVYFNGRYMVGDDDGVLHELKPDVFLDGTDEIIRERHLGVIRAGEPIGFSSLELDVQTGTGTPGTDYTMELSYSNDGGKTYNNSRAKSLGAGGEYNRHVEWWRLGRSEQRVFKLVTSAQCPIKIRGGWLKAR